MKPKTLGIILKLIIIGMAVCGAVVCAYVIPEMGIQIIEVYTELESWYKPWLIFILIAAIPCYMALAIAWSIAVRVGRDNSFCRKNATAFKYIAYLAAFDSAYFMIGNIVLLLMSKNHPSIIFASLIAVFLGVSICTAALVLSHLVFKAALIKEENDLTI